MDKILIVSHDNLLYGASRSMLDWASNVDIDNDKYSFIFLLPRSKGELKDKLEELGFKTETARYYQPIRKYNTKGLDVCVKNFVRKILCYIFNPLAIRKIEDICKKEGIKVIHSNSLVVSVGAEAAYNLKIPHVWHIREFMEEDHMMSYIYNDRFLHNLTMYSYPIFISNAIKSKFEGMFKQYDGSVLYNTIHYDHKYEKTRNFMEDGICNLIIVGKITKNKGQMEAVTVVADLLREKYKVKLFLCGEGPDEASIRKYIVSNGLNDDVVMLGYREDVSEIRKNMDIALMCSSNEAFGRVTVEAMYYENLVIGRESAGTQEIIRDRDNGILYKDNQLKDSIAFAINNRAEAEKMIEKAKKDAISHYSMSILGSIEDLYSDIIGESN